VIAARLYFFSPRRFPSILVFGVVLCCVIRLAPGIASGQHEERPFPADFNEPIRLYTTGLGSFTRPISSPNPEAKAYFNQGFQLMYAFARAEAGRSFREAQRRDPNCAICYWGEAWAWGSYVNGRMTAEQAPRAYAAIQKAVALSDRHASPKEKALIQAMSVRYVATYDPARRAEQDRAYADAMRGVAETYPDDLDAATLYAESLFLLLPRPGMFDLKDPTVDRLMSVLESALKRDMRHPGACHMYIHTTELTTEAARAEACAEHLGSSIPDASHINHMPAHVFTRVGRWGDAVRASLQAWQSDQKAAKGEGFATYPAHDLQMLAFAASWDGQRSLAIQAGRGLTTLARDPSYHALTMVRFGRFDEMATIGPRPKDDIPGGMWDFAQGYAQLRRGDIKAARESLGRLQTTARSSAATFKIHPAKSLLGTVGGILEGEIHLAGGNAAAAIGSFERAVSIQDSLIVDDPEPLPFSARHWLGAALLEANRFADAERIYREDLARHPRNGWALTGLQQSLKNQGKPSSTIEEEFRRSWARADTPITNSRF
jgi:tetratricopeptide (TPR) repeat protein